MSRTATLSRTLGNIIRGASESAVILYFRPLILFFRLLYHRLQHILKTDRIDEFIILFAQFLISMSVMVFIIFIDKSTISRDVRFVDEKGVSFIIFSAAVLFFINCSTLVASGYILRRLFRHRLITRSLRRRYKNMKSKKL